MHFILIFIHKPLCLNPFFFQGYKWRPHATRIVADANITKYPTDPCSHWYPGSRAFQSPEVNDIANWVATLQNVMGFIDLRSYGQMSTSSVRFILLNDDPFSHTHIYIVSTPYSYSCRRIVKDAEDQLEAAMGASHSLKAAHGTVFKVYIIFSLFFYF